MPGDSGVHNPLLAAVASTVAAATAAAAAAPAPASTAWQDGVNYARLVPAQPTSVPAGQVEVLEFFWYACPHCYALDPLVAAWEKSKPSYISFSRVPVLWNEGHRSLARLFYTLESMGKLNQFHAGLSVDRGLVQFAESAELGTLNANQFPFTQGTGLFINQPSGDVAPVGLGATTLYTGLYATDTLDVTSRLSVTAGGRYNFAQINLTDQLGNDALLNGNHTYTRTTRRWPSSPAAWPADARSRPARRQGRYRWSPAGMWSVAAIVPRNTPLM